MTNNTPMEGKGGRCSCAFAQRKEGVTNNEGVPLGKEPKGSSKLKFFICNCSLAVKIPYCMLNYSVWKTQVYT